MLNGEGLSPDVLFRYNVREVESLRRTYIMDSSKLHDVKDQNQKRYQKQYQKQNKKKEEKHEG